ncbi:MAG: hypothetical protein PWP03_553 [Candidatus Woesearchaeota archaeon]|nr:hypothetical protein [Candidatus Woesearchaeota archaeon]
MDDFLLVYLTIIGMLALYWVLFGEKKFKTMMENGIDKSENLKENHNVKDNENSNLKQDTPKKAKNQEKLDVDIKNNVKNKNK